MGGLRSRLGLAKRAAFTVGRRLRCAVAQHAVCLIYHRVANLDIDSQQLAVSPEHFRAHLRYLKAEYRLLDPEGLHTEITGGRMPPKGVVITFDDGYADNYLTMLPIIEEEKVPVTVFVSTDLLGTDQEFWWDELERIFLASKPLPVRLECDWGGQRLEWPTDSESAIREAYSRLHPMVKTLPPEERERRLSALRTWAGAGDCGRPTHRSLTPEELVTLGASRYVTIGAHTRSHTALAFLDPGRQRLEIEGSKTKLEAILGKPVRFFSYPFGEKRDYTRETPAICRELGFTGAYSNFYGHIFAGTDPFQIPRMLVRNWGVTEFAQRMQAFFRS